MNTNTNYNGLENAMGIYIMNLTSENISHIEKARHFIELLGNEGFGVEDVSYNQDAKLTETRDVGIAQLANGAEIMYLSSKGYENNYGKLTLLMHAGDKTVEKIQRHFQSNEIKTNLTKLNSLDEIATTITRLAIVDPKGSKVKVAGLFN